MKNLLTPMAVNQLKRAISWLSREKCVLARHNLDTTQYEAKIAVLYQALEIVAPDADLSEIKTVFSPFEVSKPRLLKQKPSRLVIQALKVAGEPLPLEMLVERAVTLGVAVNRDTSPIYYGVCCAKVGEAVKRLVRKGELIRHRLDADKDVSKGKTPSSKKTSYLYSLPNA